MTDKVISMSKETNNAKFRSIEDALKDALEAVGSKGEGAFEHGKKILILALDDDDGQYKVSFMQAGMRMSECVALCEASKGVFLDKMGY